VKPLKLTIMKEIKITKENISELKVGDKIKYHNGYEWEYDILTEFEISRGYIPTGIHNETANFLHPMFGDGVYLIPDLKEIRNEKIKDLLS
jgi:hypothetical protein